MELETENRVDVLIAGAGPAGLMLACQLAMLQISFRIIDKKSSPIKHSGALIVHARTLEIFQQMGLAEKAINAGIIAKTINLQFNENKTFTIDISKIFIADTQFPSLLMLEQCNTEGLLNEFLIDHGFVVENNTTFLSFNQEDNFVISKILRADGSIEQVKSRYLIGADGSKSLVRTQLNIPFAGKSQTSRLFITDCEAENQSTEQEISFSFASDFTSGFFPLLGNRWRVDGHIPVIQDKEVKFEAVRNFFLGKPNSAILLHTPQWFSVFRSHSRCAEHFRKNNCFLMGDAAHIHSPVGAQGMNTGLQDAHNLAWKISMVIQKKAVDQLLDTYETERRPLALSIIRSTDWAYSLMTSRLFLIRFLRVSVIPIVLPILLSLFKNKPNIPARIFRKISGIEIKYRNTLLQDSSTNSFPSSSPKSGDRFPNLNYSINGKQLALYDAMSITRFQLFIFGKDLVASDIQVIIDKYSDFISITYIAKVAGTKIVFETLGILNEGFYLVRPDNFIAYRSRVFDVIGLGNYLQKFLI